MSQRNNDNTKRQKPKENQLGIFKKFTHFAGKFSKRPGFQERESCWGYISIYESTPKKLPHLSPKNCHSFT